MSQTRTHWLEGRGRGRSRLVRFETWHITSKDSQTGGEEGEERVGELRNMARHTRGLTCWRGERRRSGLVSLETWHVTNEDSPTGGEEGGEEGRVGRKRRSRQTTSY